VFILVLVIESKFLVGSTRTRQLLATATSCSCGNLTITELLYKL